MEMYSDRLEREVREFKTNYPEISKLIDKVLEINKMSNSEFDYNIERTHLMFRECIKIILK